MSNPHVTSALHVGVATVVLTTQWARNLRNLHYMFMYMYNTPFLFLVKAQSTVRGLILVPPRNLAFRASVWCYGQVFYEHCFTVHHPRRAYHRVTYIFRVIYKSNEATAGSHPLVLCFDVRPVKKDFSWTVDGYEQRESHA